MTSCTHTKHKLRLLPALALAAGLSACVAISETDVSDPAVTAELQSLRAREDIRELIHAYGATLDARDWDGFAALWASDAEYVGGPGGQAVVGPEAIAGFLEGIFAANPSGLEGPTAHLFFNEHIEVSGTRASGSSLGGFVAQDASPGAGAQMIILARYEDEYVREDGRWTFARRVVQGLIPAPAAR